MGNNSSSKGLVQRILEKQEFLLTKYKVELRVVGAVHTCGMHRTDITLREEGLDLQEALDEMESSNCNDNSVPKGKRMSSIVPVRVLQRLRQMSCPIIVDCNRLEVAVSDFYRTCQQLGIHVVVSNAASVVRMEDSTVDTSLVTYDTCVGASVPVCDTIRTLSQMGDEVVRIEGSFSGTCGYIASGLTNGRKLSEVVSDALSKGYAEPEVWSDLAGIDVARKLVALARHMGRRLVMDDILRVPLLDSEVMEAVEGKAGAEAVGALQGYDDVVSEKMIALRQSGKKLAYIASMDFTGPTIKAVLQPLEVDEAHPAYQLKDTEIYAQIERDGFRAEHPLILQGPGCGSASAVGIVGDILKTALKLQGTVL